MPEVDQVEAVVVETNDEYRYLYESGKEYIQSFGVDETVASFAASAIGCLIIVLIAFLVNWIAKRIILRLIDRVVKRTKWQWDNVFQDQGVFTRLSHLAPAFVINSLGPIAVGGNDIAVNFIEKGVMVYVVVIMTMVLSAVINGMQVLVSRTKFGEETPVKGFVQAVKLVIFLISGILILSVLFGKSPVYFLSGIGALTAVLLLVFRDALLGFVAGVMISANQMVRMGDWIEMPSNGADGDVIDVSLTTVKVRNWDKTITTIPSYDLISKSFRNWRGMFEAGGRRIKRAIYIDMQTVAFVNEEQLQRFKRIRLLNSYLNEKLAEVIAENEKEKPDMEILCNGRRLTNLGTFRAYCIAYLKNNKFIHKDLTFLVRQLAPTEHGLPLEIYVFTTDTRWAYYEGIQADIFDHLLAVIEEFGLRVYQKPSGYDMQIALGQSSEAAIQKRPEQEVKAEDEQRKEEAREASHDEN